MKKNFELAACSNYTIAQITPPRRGSERRRPGLDQIRIGKTALVVASLALDNRSKMSVVINP